MKYSEVISYYKAANKKLPTTGELQEAVREVNGVIFPELNSIVFQNRTKRLSKSLIELGLKVKSLDCAKALQKQKEVLSFIRNTVLDLRKIKEVDGDNQDAQRTVSFALSRSISLKENNPTTEDILGRLRANKEVMEDLGEHWNEVKTMQFEKVQTELIQMITNQYELSNENGG